MICANSDAVDSRFSPFFFSFFIYTCEDEYFFSKSFFLHLNNNKWHRLKDVCMRRGTHKKNMRPTKKVRVSVWVCVCSWKRVRENGHLNSTMACWLYSILQLYSTSVCFYIFCIQLVRYSFACLPLLCNAMLCMCLCWWHKSSLIITHLNIE